MRRPRLNLLLLCLSGIFILPLRAQNSTNLPTSMYGVGELSPGEGGRYAGMGNVGIALNRAGFQNSLNPAAITRMDSASFVFDVGATAAYASYSYLSDQSQGLTANPNRFSLGFRVMRGWYVMLGATPYSSVGYLIRTQEPVEGAPEESIYSSFQGEGGLYRCYLTNAFRLGRRLSVGINVGMILGTTTQSETQENATVEYESKKRGFHTSLGLYYDFNPDGRRRWSAGLLYSPSMPLTHDNTLIYDNSSTSEDMEKPYHQHRQYLPTHLGAGVSMSTDRWLLTADYNYMDWSRNTSTDSSYGYENQHKIIVGANYNLHPRRPRSTELMLGLGYGNSYINMKGRDMNYLEASAGISIPVRYSYLSLGVTWRQQMNRDIRVMQESRWTLNLNLTFGERISRSRIR